MSEDFMSKLRRDPPPELEAGLRERLRRQGPAGEGAGALLRRARFYRPALAVAAAAAIVVAFVLSPALRASAQAFLDLFRVRNFAAITVDSGRLEQLNHTQLDVKSLLGDQVQELEKPGPPQVVPDAGAASAVAGFAVRTPVTLPTGLMPDTLLVRGRAVARVTVDARKLRQALEALGVSDVRLPDRLDGAQATVRVPPAVVIRYRQGKQVAVLMQAPSPVVELPPGLDLRQLGEIGLRVLGLSPEEAHRFAGTIDWRSTVLIPVPSNASSFREVDVHGQRGLLVTTTGAPTGTETGGRRGAVVMWSEGDRVYALAGNIASEDLLLMAGSLR
ncbi:MAG TPA: hypothetical protein VMS93_13885 [Candidatus Saccharimonadales bacterium]|nr:hypothetical protein [Candidatus Saccharimonadales bacterium]